MSRIPSLFQGWGLEETAKALLFSLMVSPPFSLPSLGTSSEFSLVRLKLLTSKFCFLSCKALP